MYTQTWWRRGSPDKYAAHCVKLGLNHPIPAHRIPARIRVKRWRDMKKIDDPTDLVKKRIANQLERASLSQCHEKKEEQRRKDKDKRYPH